MIKLQSLLILQCHFIGNCQVQLWERGEKEGESGEEDSRKHDVEGGKEWGKRERRRGGEKEREAIERM